MPQGDTVLPAKLYKNTFVRAWKIVEKSQNAPAAAGKIGDFPGISRKTQEYERKRAVDNRGNVW